ncbi:hypothetical protein [Novosphingobium arvoryzae]|uniref:Uncharacterized protein n=1 Tax=Novosphingobium arvoryzae TaxID=1256514 RepID=A0A918VBM0_9SPHN|nr:hypothetical protein [Novosphingobium arvoryzae]GGZ86360.1 hypothetical protein GCM10011617_01150 [Novosphingobium arvoryzae]
MATEQELNDRLQKIQGDAQEQHRLHVGARNLLHRNLADAYVWWLEAIKQPKSYLDSIFKTNAIETRSTSNEVNFNPIIRLIFKMQAANAGTASQWSAALRVVHEYYQANESHLRRVNDIEGEIAAFIRKKGGISGLRLIHNQIFDADNPDALTSTATVEPKRKPTKGDKYRLDTEAKIFKSKRSLLKDSKSLGAVEISDIATNDDDLIVVLAKRNPKTGKLEAVGTTNDDDVIRQAIMESVDTDVRKLAPNLRLIVECLRPHIVPHKLQKLNVRKTFFLEHDLGKNKEGKDRNFSEFVRFVLTKSGAIIASKSPSTASLTTISQPNVPFELERDIFLRGKDRFWIETELLNNGQMPLFKVTTEQGLLDAPANLTASKMLVLKNQQADEERRIYFYDYENLDEEQSYQPVPVDQISYDWQIDADKKFVTRFYRKQLDQWLVLVKKNIHLASNKTMKLVLADSYLEARSHFVKDQPGVNEEGYARFADDYYTLYGRDAKVEHLTDAPAEITVSPLDIVELFATLANVPTKGRIMIRGNTHIMNISYETATAKHEAFIPACDHDGQRDATYFKWYVPNA